MSKENEHNKQKLKVIQFDRTKNTFVETTEPQEKFDDVGGLEEVKKKIRKHPNLIRNYEKQDLGN